MLRGIAAVLLLVAVGLGPAAAHAQERDARAAAVDLFAQSVTAYREGRFDDAAHLLDQAYALQPEPVLLYNLGRAREGSGDDAGAADAYRRYLEADGTDATDASAARARLVVLDRRIEEHRALEALAAQREAEAEASRRPPPPPPAREIAVAPWIIAGVGAAALVVGGVLGAMMSDRSSAAQAAPIQADAAAAQHDAETFAIAADVCFGVGALALGVGAIWGIVDLTTAPSSDAHARLRLGPSGLSLTGTF